MKTYHKIKKCGFTLTEVLLAIMIISVGVLATAGLISNALANSKRTNDDMIAVSFSDMVFATMREGMATTNWSMGDDLVVYEGGLLQDDEAVVKTSSGSQNRFYNVIDLDRKVSFTPYAGSLGYVTNYMVTYEINKITSSPSELGVEIKVWPGYDTGDNIGVRPRVFYNEFSSLVP